MNDTNLPTFNQNPSDSYINAYTPPTVSAAAPTPMPQPTPTTFNQDMDMPSSGPATAPISTPASANSEKIEDQNIFSLLGVDDGTEEEKEAFLDELQQVIWEDFLENDVDLLLTEDEKKQLDQLKAKAEKQPEQSQEEMVIFLEKLIPDLEEIMLEKALELKEDMVKERIAGLKEFFVGKQDELDVVSQAETMINNGQWSSAAHKLNSLSV